MAGPDPGSFVVEPTNNGWIVLHWPYIEDDEDEDEAEPGYDPSREFAREQQQPIHPAIVAGVMRGDITVEPNRYVFTDRAELMSFMDKLTQQSGVTPKAKDVEPETE